LKKAISILLGLFLIIGLTACGANQKTDKNAGTTPQKMTKLVVGASPVPHAEILNHIKPILKKKGIDLQVKEFQDYVLPNKALATGELDANYFQHIPYLESQEKEMGYKFANVGKVHIEPIGIYSKKYKSVKDLPNGATIIMSNSVSDEGRLLGLLQQAGLIKLKTGVGYNATFKDIVSNPKHLKLAANYDAGLLPKIYNNNEGDAVMINTNYALAAGLNPLKDAIAIESGNSPFANIVVTQEKNKNNPAIKTLVDVLQSKDVQQWILDKWKGAIVPVKLSELKQSK
jgi:D-methionine transport system substrate-binding protein